MPDIFDDTIDEVHETKNAAAAGATPDTSSEVIASEGQSASPAESQTDTQTSDPTAESSETAGEGAREGEGQIEAQATTETEITGHENVEELLKRDGVAAKFMRRTLPLIKQAGGMQMFRAGADIVAAGNDPTTDGPTFAKTVSAAIGQSRWTELRNDIVFTAIDANREVVLRDLMGDEAVTLDEAKRALADFRQWNGDEGQTATPEPGDLSGLDPELRKEIEGLRELKKQLPELQNEVKGFRTERQTATEQKRAADIDSLGKELYGSVFSVVTERVNRLGLEPKPTDSPRVKGIKGALSKALSTEALEAAFEANQERSALGMRALDKVNRLEREGAFAYRDALAVMAEATLNEVVESDEVRSLLEALKSELTAQSTPKDPSARDEIVQGAPAANTPADRWSQRQEGEDFFDVGARLAREKVSARG